MGLFIVLLYSRIKSIKNIKFLNSSSYARNTKTYGTCVTCVSSKQNSATEKYQHD